MFDLLCLIQNTMTRFKCVTKNFSSIYVKTHRSISSPSCTVFYTSTFCVTQKQQCCAPNLLYKIISCMGLREEFTQMTQGGLKGRALMDCQSLCSSVLFLFQCCTHLLGVSVLHRWWLSKKCECFDMHT